MIFFTNLWKKSSTVSFLKWLLLIIICLLLVVISRGQNNISFRHITSADGLTSNNTGKIIQDSRGFLWICTEDGLNMYDGQTIKQYFLSDYIPSQANSNAISGIAEDADHNILLAAKAGIIKFSWDTKQFSVVYKNSFTSFGNVNPDLFVDAAKNIWVNERVRLKKFDPHFHLLHTWTLRDSSNSKNLNSPSVIFICGEDAHHNIWFTDSTLIFRIDASTNKIDSSQNQKMQNLNSGYRHTTMMSFTENSVWILEKEHTLVHLNSSFQFIHSYELPKQITPFYSGIIEQNEKTWIATRFNGVFVLDINTAQVQHYGESNALTSDDVANIAKDASGNIWISTLTGMNELKASASFFHQLNFDIPNDSIAQKSIIHNVFFKNNTLFTFLSYGIIQTQLANNRSEYFFDSGEKKSGGVYYASAFPIQDKWLLSRHHDIEILEFKNYRPVFSSFVLSHPAKLDLSGIISFYQDRDNNIWMGMVNDGGIVCWNTGNNNFSIYTQKDTGKYYCPLRHFSYATEDDYGNIWMGYDKGGISIFNRKQNRFVSIPSHEKNSVANVAVLGMTNDHHGSLWIATNTGLIQYDETKNQYKEFTRKDGLPSNFVKSIITDDSGNVWLGFEGALAEINASTNVIITYTTSDGLPGADLENPFYDPASETMFFCTDRSVVYFNPRQVEKVFPILSPVVTSFQVMGKEQAFAGNKELKIPYSNNYLSFSFSAPNFINASETEYACKLDGADKDWNYLGNHHFANYSQLQPGNYIFRVMARVKSGKWRQAATPLVINIETPFWRTAWFRIGSVVLFLVIVFSFVYLRLRNKFEKQILAQSIRDKIAGDLHDDIGSTLMSISILSELAKNSSQAAPYLENISKNALIIQENMSDIVWAINPTNDRFVNIIQRMSQFAVEILEPKNIEVKFNSDSSLSALVLPMDIRRNFYLFFKEAINNCAKHSMAAQVNILVSYNGQQINLNITDNGKGFDAFANHKGNGMSTMKKRAEELGGHVKIISAPGKGTAINLDFAI